jgi:phosphoribosyl 1,2-cyclic phosphodiesterase
MITFIPFASGSSGNLYIVSDGTTIIMLDCGLPWKKLQRLLDFKTSEIAGILCSHSHADHSKGIIEAAGSGLDIYASKETFQSLELSGHRYIEIADKEKFEVGTWTILPFSTSHDCKGSLGFLMANKEGENFLYLTDTMYAPIKFGQLTMIACEANYIGEILSQNIQSGVIPAVVGRRVRHTHFSLETLIDMLRSNDLSRCRAIYLIHLSDGNSDEAAMIQKVQETTGIPCYAA